MKFLKTLCFAVFLFGSLGWATIGEDPTTILNPLVEMGLENVGDNVYQLESLSFFLELRSRVVYHVTGEASLDEETVPVLSTLITTATGGTAELEDAVKQFFTGGFYDILGQGIQTLRVQNETYDFMLDLDITGEEAPYNVQFTLRILEVPEDDLPTTSHSIGPANARYVIREFSDFQCPFCARYSADALPLVKEELLSRGDVRFEFHHFPLVSIHANAFAAAEASECVVAANTNNDEAFWDYHDALFSRQRAWQGLADPGAYFSRLAKDIGLSDDGVEACLENGEFNETITEATDNAVAIGLRGTPSVLVNGFSVKNFNSVSAYEEIITLIDAFSR